MFQSGTDRQKKLQVIYESILMGISSKFHVKRYVKFLTLQVNTNMHGLNNLIEVITLHDINKTKKNSGFTINPTDLNLNVYPKMFINIF